MNKKTAKRIMIISLVCLALALSFVIVRLSVKPGPDSKADYFASLDEENDFDSDKADTIAKEHNNNIEVIDLRKTSPANTEQNTVPKDRENQPLPDIEGFQIKEKVVQVDEMANDYTFVVVNDMHIVSPEDIDNPNNDSAGLKSRFDMFTYDGKSSLENWEELASKLDSFNADMILFVGDMMDYYSEANFNNFSKELAKLNTPYMYVRADHDTNPFWNQGVDFETIRKSEEQLDGFENIIIKEYDDLILLGINNNTGQLPLEAVSRIKDTFAKGKPIIMIAHVPFDSILNDDLANASKDVWAGRVLLWGNKDQDTYKPDANTQVLLDLLYSDDSPVMGIASGHLHFPFETMISDSTIEWVFDKSYSRNIGVIRVENDL